VRWPGRLELLAIGPEAIDVLLDGAHNVDGARALAGALADLRPFLAGGRPTLLMGTLRDKDASGMVEALAGGEALRGARVVTTTVPDAPRSLAAAELASMWRERSPAGSFIAAIGDASEALDHALAAARAEGGPLISCGSLYLVGAVRGRLVDDPESKDPPLPGRDGP
jgi:dihydrofolate synthase/folylpolyglutamate synthase